MAAVDHDMRTAIRATITHDRETWDARVGRALTGRDHNGRPLSSRAIVLSIDPDGRTLVTRGGMDWAPYAQVHQISDVEWVDLETEDVHRGALSDAVSARAADGWTLYDTLDLVDSEEVRAMFTRPLG